MSKLQVISDMAALARAGFKMDDIKAIMAEPEASAEKPAETLPKESKLPEQEKEQDEKSAEAKEEPDYKRMYEELNEKQTKLERDLKAAQEFNTSKTVQASNEKTAAEKINEIYKDIIS